MLAHASPDGRPPVTTSPATRRKDRAGFTLVEMLVAVGLVVLLMSLFATIFQFATQSLAVHKGATENDQKVRLALTLLRSDLSRRTAQRVQPWQENDLDTNAPDRDDTERKGYFYIGENDRDDETDDTLQLTIHVPDSDESVLFGHAVLLPNAPGANNIYNNPNQPEFDDGDVSDNKVGSSHYAEVSYFLRRGTLYRRVLLIREPIVGDLVTNGATPFSGATGDVSQIPMPEYQQNTATANFLTDLDYSGYFDGTGPRFHGVADLDNASAVGANARLGKPQYRFGHNRDSGLPREFIGANPNPVFFIGRFTHWETSYQPTAPYAPGAGNTILYFGYPGRKDIVAPVEAPNPMDPATPLTVDPNSGLVTSYTLFNAAGQAVPGRRASEDVLLTNVHRFDIKVWDEQASNGPDGAPGNIGDDNPLVVPGEDDSERGWPGSDDGAFRDVGHNSAAGFGYYSENSAILAQQRGGAPFPYCEVHPADPNPAAPTRRLWRFDTWNPNVDLDESSGPPAVPAAAPYDPPPFRAPRDPQVPIDPLETRHARRPLKAIQIRLSFFDPTSQQMRDVTFIKSLTTEP